MEKLCTQLVNQLMDAAVDNPAEARRLLSAYPGLLAACGQFGETALHLLAVEGYTAAVRFLAEAGADVNARAELGDPPLNDVAVLGNDEIAEILLAHGHPNAT